MFWILEIAALVGLPIKIPARVELLSPLTEIRFICRPKPAFELILLEIRLEVGWPVWRFGLPCWLVSPGMFWRVGREACAVCLHFKLLGSTNSCKMKKELRPVSATRPIVVAMIC